MFVTNNFLIKLWLSGITFWLCFNLKIYYFEVAFYKKTGYQSSPFSFLAFISLFAFNIAVHLHNVNAIGVVAN